MDLKSNEPFWLVKNGLINSYPSLHEDITCDVLVVGCGITGSLIAHQCVADGYNTVMIDQREVANGSTSATTSMLQYEIDVPLYQLIDQIGKEGAIASYKACSDAIDKLAQVAKSIKSKAGFKRKKSLYFAAYKKDVPSLEKEYQARLDAGFKVKWLTAEEIQESYNLQNTYGGILSEQGASVDAFRLTHELHAYNVKKGLRIYDKSALKRVNEGSRLNECVLDTGAIIKAKKIIYCVGFESAQMIKEHFVDLISTYAMVSEIDTLSIKGFEDILIWNTADPYIYMRTTDDGRFLIGGEDEPFVDPKKRDQMIYNKVEKLSRSFSKIIPDRHFHEDFSWAGTFGETKDGLPYIGEHPDFPRSYFVLGFGGNGITFSVTGMDMVAAWLVKKTHNLSEYFAFGR